MSKKALLHYSFFHYQPQVNTPLNQGRLTRRQAEKGYRQLDINGFFHRLRDILAARDYGDTAATTEDIFKRLIMSNALYGVIGSLQVQRHLNVF